MVQPAFVAKVNALGEVAYASLFGAALYPTGLAVSASGEAHVTGSVSGTEFPATPGAAVNISSSGFVAKLDFNGAQLLYVQRGIGGSMIAVDSADNVYAAGTVFGEGARPITPGAFQLAHESRACGGTGFVGIPCAYQHIAKIDSTGRTLLYATFLTGSFGATPTALAVDPSGNVVVAGTTGSRDFPTTPGVVGPAYLATTRHPSQPAFVLPFRGLRRPALSRS